jgi:hypothetical protein
MRRIAAKFVSRLLESEQKQHRLEVCRKLQQPIQEDRNFPSKVVTGSLRLLSLLQYENHFERAKI